MAVTVDDQRQGVPELKWAVAGYLTGWALIAAGAIFGDGDSDPHGVTVMAIGGAIILASIVVPWIVRLVESAAGRHQRQDLTDELAEVEVAVHEALAASDQRTAQQIRDLRQLVAGINSQLR